MSGLARLVAGHVPPGVYHWTSAARADAVRHAAERAGWRFLGLDTWRVEDAAEFAHACAETLVLSPSDEDPADVEVRGRRGLDWLAATLAGVSAGDGHGVVVLWTGWAPFARADRVGFDAAVKAFADRAAHDRPSLFAVLLSGPGPETGLAEIDPHGHEPATAG